MGWAVLSENSGSPIYVSSGIIACDRGAKEDFQPYRLRLIEHTMEEAIELLHTFDPAIVVSEIVPAVGGGNFIAATQSELAKAALTAFQVLSLLYGVELAQLGATTIKARIGGSKKATKVRVRNGVIDALPELVDRRKEWVKVFDESDAIAVGLAYLQIHDGVLHSTPSSSVKSHGRTS
jgi:Holliday junction resolvasome RuvABC endonuclease subunit